MLSLCDIVNVKVGIGRGVFEAPGATVIGGSTPTFDQQIQKLFANNEQGFFYDPNDLSTMFQDAAGTNPVTTTGQPVGLLLDKSNGLIRGAEFWNHASAITVGESSIVSANTYRIKSTDGSSSYVYCSGASTSKFYEVSFDIVSITGNISTDVENAPVWSSVGRKRYIGKPLGGWLTIKRSGVCDAVVANVSVREIKGNHAYQTTSAARPILQDAPRRIDFDAVDDKLITNLPEQLSGCTVVRSVPNVGTQILTNQTIPTPYNGNSDHCGLIVVNRALTATETSQITKLFNKAAGV